MRMPAWHRNISQEYLGLHFAMLIFNFIMEDWLWEILVLNKNKSMHWSSKVGNEITQVYLGYEDFAGGGNDVCVNFHFWKMFWNP